MSAVRPNALTTRRVIGRCVPLAILWLALADGHEARSGSQAASTDAPRSTAPSSQTRRPVAIALNRERDRLLVANRNSGTLSVLDARTRRWLLESQVGRGVSDLAPLPGDGDWVVVDQADDSVLHVTVRGDQLEVVARLPVRTDPVRLAVGPDGATVFVTSRWGRCVSTFDWDRATRRLKPGRTIELPFSPHDLLPVRDGSALVVADAFGGNLAAIEPRRGRIVAVRALPAHNIRGLALTTDDTLLVAHQELNPKGRAIQDDVQWGALLTNKVRPLKLDTLLNGGVDVATRPVAEERPIDLGRISGDPAALACGPNGRVVLALAGVDQLVLGPDFAHLETRVPIGRRPTALAVDWERGEAFVAETLDDSISIHDIRTGARLAQTVLGPVREPSLADRGERLFFDARLSRGGWMSCQSCHTDGHSNGLNVDTIGDGDYGAPKRVPSLLGVGTTGPWSWNGRLERLDEQVHQSAVTTVQGVWPTESEVAELTAYLTTLKAPRPIAAGSADPAIRRGEAIFEARCVACHAPPDYTSQERFDVGLVDEVGRRTFNPPSLRGVGVRAPLLHDGRARSLEDVFRTHGHPRDARWTDQQVRDLVRFLETL